MSLLDVEQKMDLATAMATIKDLREQVAQRDAKIKELEIELSSERTVAHNTSFHDHLVAECQSRMIAEELRDWRALGSKLLKSIEGDAKWESLKKMIYLDEEDPEAFKYQWQLRNASDNQKDDARIMAGVQRSIDNAMKAATDRVNAVVKDHRDYVEKERAKAQKKLDLKPF